MTAGPGSSPDTSQERCSKRKNSGTKETIHSGQFMVSDFEAEAQDDEGIEIPEPTEVSEQVEEIKGVKGFSHGGVIVYAKPTSASQDKFDTTTVSIDSSLTKLFKTMSLAYKQKITSPKWNRFKGLRLRWKDKIRLNNVIWRCWHMQYMQRKRMTVCQFTLDVDIHNRPETIVLEGKYWKRRMEAVTAEYKKWRVYYKNRFSGVEPMPDQQDMLNTEMEDARNELSLKSFLGLEEMDWARSFLSKEGVSLEDGDVFQCIDFTDMLFSPFLTSPQLFPFPNPREIARGTGNSDLQQPGLIQLQPDLTDDDMMDFQEMLAGRGLGLPTVFEEDINLTEPEMNQPPSPPSVSTPVPQAPIEYTARLTATHVYSPPSTPATLSLPEPTSPQMFPHDHFILPEPAPPQPAHQPVPVALPHRQPQLQPQQVLLPTINTQELQSEGSRFCTRQEIPPRPFYRSRSDQHLDTSSPRSVLRQDDNSSFAMPKAIPRRRSHSGSLPYPSPVNNTQVINATSAPNISSSLHHGPNLLPLTSSNVHTPQILTTSHSRQGLEPGAIYSSPDSALLAHLLTSDAYPSPIPTVNHVITATSSNSSTQVGIKKVPTLAPRLEIPGSSGCSSANHINTSVVINSRNESPSYLSSITTSTAQQPSILPNITLLAVTPSSIKSIHSNTHIPKWSSGVISRPIKTSPPYSEPTSPQSCSGVSSPSNKPFRPKSEVERTQYKEHRRVCHINAEQKRRYNIKNNFDMLHSLIPSVNHNPNAKVSKATMLHKGAEYILQLKQEKHQLIEHSEKLRQQIEQLNCEISTAQSLLPATGAPMTHTRHNKMKERFEAYVREQTLINPKYYIMSLITESMMESFNSTVSTASVDDLCRSGMAWLDQHCSLNVLRPVASNAMRKLSTTTSILTTPEKLPEDIFREVTKQERKKSNGSQFSNPMQR